MTVGAMTMAFEGLRAIEQARVMAHEYNRRGRVNTLANPVKLTKFRRLCPAPPPGRHNG